MVKVAYKHADGEVEELVYDRVVRATGFRFDDAIFQINNLDLVTDETIIADPGVVAPTTVFGCVSSSDGAGQFQAWWIPS